MFGSTWLIWFVVPSAAAALGWFTSRRPLGPLLDHVRLEGARLQFHQQREWLEARFLTSVARSDPAEFARWEDAHWLDEVRWVRDRQTRELLALVGVEFEVSPFDDPQDRHATALFEYRKCAWVAAGKRVDSLRPEEALRRHRRYEQVL